MDLAAPLPPRSVVWIRSESLLERSCPSGSPLLPSRPQHPSDLVATPMLEDGGGGGEGSIITLPPSGPVRYTSTWELGEVEESSEDGYTIKFGTSFPTGRASLKRTVGRDEVYVANPARLDGIPDMSRLSDLSQPCLLYNLLVRYRCDAIYTFTGPLLISINPFKRIDDIYSNEVMSTYFGSNLTNMEPHVFCAAESARQGLIREGKSQSIVISGESGSGKTEAAKYILSYLARSVSSSSSSSSSGVVGGAGQKGGGIEEHILQTNPITEALGNAKTMRNSNSSRFGKFVRVRFGYGGATMQSAFIDHYLLEKPRVTHQPEGERNYHAFYQLCGGAGEALRAQLGIGAAADHRYTSQSGCTVVEGVDDEADFEELVGAMWGMGMSTEDEMSIMRTLAGILHLGDVSFSSAKDGSGQLEHGSSAEWAGKLLGLQVEDMRTAICTRSIKAGLDTLSVPKSKDEALSSRDAVARVVYTKMFEWVITAINGKLGKTGRGTASTPSAAASASAPNAGFGSASDTFIGLLDIFGFEVMDRNGFEQLCINYANEKLQLFFNDRMLHLEQRAYQEEGVEWEFVDFTDNASVLSTLEGRPSGLLPTLDDQCLFATSTDASFLQVLSKSHETTAEITFPKIKQAAFVVRHSAGPVEYDISGFLEKNKDMLFSDLTSMMSSSSNAFISALFEEQPGPPPATGRTPTRGQGGKASQHVSVSAKFRHQLSGLMRSLEQTNPLFVRCIKPNHDKSPAFLDGQLVDHQLRCSGVLAAVKISQCGFPSRVPFTEFSTRYMPLLSKAPASGTDRKQVCATLLDQLGIADSDFQMGRTRIFFKAGVIASLEQTLSNAVSDSAALLQAHVRSSSSMRLSDMRCAARALQGGSKRRKARSEYFAEVEMHRALSILQASCRGMIYFGRILGMHSSAILIQKIVKGRQTRRRVADAQARQRALQDRFASQSSPQASPSPSPAKPGARAHFDASSEVASSPATKAPLPAKGSVPGPPPPPRSQGPSLSAILSACQDVGVQATRADEEEGEGLGMDGEAGGGRAGDFLVLPGGEQVSAHDVLLMRDENRKLQVVLELSRRNPDTPFTSPAPAKTLKNLGGLLGGPSPAKSDLPMSPIDRLAQMPAEKELECEHIMSKMRLNMREFANVMDVARIGLRQGEELCKANAELEGLRAEVAKLRGEKQAYLQMQEVVMIQTAQLAEMADAKRELEDRLLEGNMRRVSIEEALDNMKHWQEVNQEKHRRNEERLAELEPEHEDATSQLLQFKVRVAEMDSANCVLAAELNRLRKAISEQGGAAAAAAVGSGNGGAKPDAGASGATPRSTGTFLGSMGIPSPFRSTPREGTPPSSS